jgi:hypothetical protein
MQRPLYAKSPSARAIRPSGIIDAFTSGLILPPAELLQILSDPFEPSFDIAAEVNADYASLFVAERQEIAECLGALEHSEPIRLTRNRDVLGCISREHDEHARVRSTLMELARGMQVTQPVPEGGDHPEAIAENTTERLQCLVPRGCALKEGQ